MNIDSIRPVNSCKRHWRCQPLVFWFGKRKEEAEGKNREKPLLDESMDVRAKGQTGLFCTRVVNRRWNENSDFKNFDQLFPIQFLMLNETNLSSHPGQRTSSFGNYISVVRHSVFPHRWALSWIQHSESAEKWQTRADKGQLESTVWDTK